MHPYRVRRAYAATLCYQQYTPKGVSGALSQIENFEETGRIKKYNPTFSNLFSGGSLAYWHIGIFFSPR
jgi:hypothetical protein